MQAAEGRSVAIDEMDREMERGLRRLRFSDPVEAVFLREYLKSRARMVPLWAFLGTLLYLVAILGDLSMMPDVAPTVIALRLGLFLPYAVAVVWIMRRWPSPATYDRLALGVGLLGLSLPMAMLVFSRSDHLFVYQTGSVGTLAFFVIVLRPRFPTVLAGLAAMVAIQIATTGLNGSFDAVTYSGIVSFHITLGIFLALSAYFAERVDRQNFLNRLRGEALQAQLTALSERDPMTGLYNRHSLRRSRHAIWAPGTARTISLLMLDIDSFKLYNDVHGHVDGDACIQRVSDIVRKQVDEQGTVFRYGGEEILILLPDTGQAPALSVAEAIRQAIEGAAIRHDGLPGGGVVTVSLGVATGRTDADDLEELLRRADTALYAAKGAGRNRVRLADPEALLPASAIGRPSP